MAKEAKKPSAQAEYSRRQTAKSQDVGIIADIADVERRESCRDSLKLFCEVYNPEAFYLGWSEPHLLAISRIEEAVKLGALFAFAMARGSGKTTLARMALLWAAAYAHRRHVLLLGATQTKADDTLEAVKTFIRFLPLFVDDFPEITQAVNHLAGTANRAAGQKCNGESTLIEWSKDKIVLPTVPVPSNWPAHWPKRKDGKAPTSGIILSASGLTADGIRGSVKTLTTGEQVRPDLVLLDDPQTDESAYSLTQNAKRLSLVSNTVLGMAGPGKKLSAVMPCTVIARGDMADEILDRKKHPLWRGERTKMLKAFPKNLKEWDQYEEVYNACAQLEPPDFTAANEHYISHRETLDEGAEASWSDRKEDGEVSAIQSAMHLYFRDRIGFMSEYQNDPVDFTLMPGSRRLTIESLQGRHTGLARGVVPRDCSKLTAFIDLGGYLHWYCVVAWNGAFGGSVIDYGCWPVQSSANFTKDDAKRKLENAYPGRSQDQYVHEGLADLANKFLSHEYEQENTEARLRIETCIIDSGFKDDIASDFVRSARTLGCRLEISKGIPRAAGRSPVGKWEVQAKHGETGGWNWRRKLSVKKKVYMVQFDTDAFKAFVYDRWTEHVAGRSAMRIFGDERTDHRLFFGHQTAECGVIEDPEKRKGSEFEKWKVVPNSGLDNDWFDCMVGCTLAASVSGLTWVANESVRPSPPKKKLTQADINRMQAERRVIATQGVA